MHTCKKKASKVQIPENRRKWGTMWCDVTYIMLYVAEYNVLDTINFSHVLWKYYSWSGPFTKRSFHWTELNFQSFMGSHFSIKVYACVRLGLSVRSAIHSCSICHWNFRRDKSNRSCVTWFRINSWKIARFKITLK